jgi:hypothetical protein
LDNIIPANSHKPIKGSGVYDDRKGEKMTVKNTEGLRRAGSRSVELLKTTGVIVVPESQKLLSDEMVREYQGKFIALTSTGPKAVIAAADDYGSLIAAVKKLKVIAYLTIPVPRMGAVYSH